MMLKLHINHKCKNFRRKGTSLIFHIKRRDSISINLRMRIHKKGLYHRYYSRINILETLDQLLIQSESTRRMDSMIQFKNLIQASSVKLVHLKPRKFQSKLTLNSMSILIPLSKSPLAILEIPQMERHL